MKGTGIAAGVTADEGGAPVLLGCVLLDNGEVSHTPLSESHTSGGIWSHSCPSDMDGETLAPSTWMVTLLPSIGKNEYPHQ